MTLKTNKTKPKNNLGFTIVELLVVIVVIGILAAITIVSYTGISKKANQATIQSEITNASKKLSMYYAEYGSYPTTAGLNPSTNWCPTAPNNNTNYCIKFSSGTDVTYTSSSPTSYELTFNRDSLGYKVINGNAPIEVAPPAPITAIAAITGTAQVSQTLTAGAVTPAEATVSYQWQSATTAGGTYTDISGATASTLTLNPSNINKYIKVKVTGTIAFTGTQTSAASTQIATDANWKIVGTQIWAAANLNTGTMVTGAGAQANNATIEKYCYNNIESNCVSYGGLYQWGEAMGYVNAESTQGVCPVGSHVPSDSEWKILEMSLSGMTQATADLSGWRGTDEGAKLRSGGSSGLNMPFAGYRYVDGSFYDLSSKAYLWSSSESGNDGWYRFMDSSYSIMYRLTGSKFDSYSVRCLGN